MKLDLPTNLLLTSILLATPLTAQPGHSIVTVLVTNVGGEIYDIDHTAQTATKLTISATLAADQPSCVLMTSPVTGYVGTNKTSGPANLYSIVIAGTTVTETLLNTTPTKGVNCAQLDLFGGRIYFCVQNPSGTVGWIQSIPTGGGPVTDEFDCSTVGAVATTNALCVMGTKIYCATFNSSPGNTAPTPGELIEYDPILKTGRLVMLLPVGKFDPVLNPWNIGAVNMRPYPLQTGVLAIQGVYGDLVYIDPATKTVVKHEWTGTKNAGGNSLASASVDAFAWNPVTQDWVVATRYGFIEIWVANQHARKVIGGIGSSATATSNRLTGIHYFPFAGGSDVSLGAGCQGAGTWEPTDTSAGAPLAPNPAFKMGLYSVEGGDKVILMLGAQNVVYGGLLLPLDLAVIGMTPSCFLRNDILVALPAVCSGSLAGEGQVTIPIPIPASAKGFKVYHQWAVLQTTPTNGLGIVVSNGRLLQIQ